ncbi:MAG: YSC84-related protein, partial [Bacteroidota bacterium]
LDFDAEVYSYSRSRGVFAGLSLDGSELKVDKEANQSYYGEDIPVEKLLGERQEMVGKEPANKRIHAILNDFE